MANINNSYVKFARCSSKSNAATKSGDNKNKGTIIFAGTSESGDGEIWLDGKRYGSSTNNNNNPGGVETVSIKPTMSVGYLGTSETLKGTPGEILTQMLVKRYDAFYNKAVIHATQNVNKFVGETMPALSEFSASADKANITSDETKTESGKTSVSILSYSSGNANSVVDDKKSITIKLKATWAAGTSEVKDNTGAIIDDTRDTPSVYKYVDDKKTTVTKSVVLKKIDGKYVIASSNTNDPADDATYVTKKVTASFWRRFKYFTSDNDNVTEIPLVSSNANTEEDSNISATNIGKVAGSVPGDDSLTINANAKYIYLLMPNDHLTSKEKYIIQQLAADGKTFEDTPDALSPVTITTTDGNNQSVTSNVSYGHYDLYKISGMRGDLTFKIISVNK